MMRHPHRENRSAPDRRGSGPYRWAICAAALVLLLPGAVLAQSNYSSNYSSGYSSAAYDRTYGDDSYGDAPAGYDTGYSYIRTLDGSATLIQGGDHADSGERSVAEINQPVFGGDRLWVSPGSHVEVVLSDGNLLRIDGDSEILFEQLAFSPETGDEVTTLRLLRGNVQAVVVTDSLGEQLPRLDTSNASVYPQDFGTYRLTSDGTGWTELVVRRGRAEVVTGDGTVAVRADQRALVEGSADRAWTDVRSAGAYDSLERWAADLDRGVEEVPYVNEELRYAAAPLERHGTWVTVDGNRAWQPRVSVGWRPYTHGRWSYSPAGLIWVSSEPWGWVPYHYGTWDYSPPHGWIWLPGRRFSPGWVYWHWGTSHVAWVPVGYYTRHWHRRYHHGFRWGVYGWAGGSWNHYRRWTFCPRGYFGTRHQRRHVYDGPGYRRRHGGRDVPRGILTTDTKRLGPRHWRHGDDALKALRTRPGRGGRVTTAELPDVTAFVERRADLPQDVRRRVAVDRVDGTRLAGTPMAPGTRAPDRRSALPRPRVDVRGDDRTDVGRRSAVIRGDGPGTADTRADRRSVGRRPSSRADGPSERSAVIRGDRPRTPTAKRPADRRVGARAGNPSASNPRADTPRAARPRVDRRPTSDAQPPSSRRRSDGTADVRGRAEVHRTPKPRTSAPRGQAPRTSTPRAPKPRTSAPREQAPRTSTPRASTPRAGSPRTSPSPRRSPPTARRGPTTDRQPTRRPRAQRGPSPNRQPTARRSPAPSRRPTVKRSPNRRSAPSRGRATAQRSPRRSPSSSARSGSQRSSSPRASSGRSSAPRRSAGSRSSSRSNGSKRSAPRRSRPRPRNDE